MQHHSPGNLRKGNRELLLRYAILALLISALTIVLLVRFNRQQRYQQLHAAVEELAETRQQKDWIGHAIQTMYAAENHFRFYTLTYQNVYFSRYSTALREVAADLDSLQQYKQQGLGGMLAEKQEQSGIFLNIKRAADSLIAMNTSWDTTHQRNILRPATGIRFAQQVRTDTVVTATPRTPVKRKKLLGRIADAVANKGPYARDTAAAGVVKTATTTSPDAQSKQYNEQQLQKLHRYYTTLFNNISSGQMQLNQQEYEMVTANDRMLKTLLADLYQLRQHEQETASQRQRVQAAGINLQLSEWYSDALNGSLLIIFMLALILTLLYVGYRTSVRLNSARLDALRFSKLKSDFVSNMSHEIRNPLSSVIGFTEQLKKTKLGGEQEEMVSAIQLSSGMLLSVVNNVLDFSKLEEGKLELAAAPFSPRQVVEEVTKGMQVQAGQKNISLRERFGFSGGELVEGDAFRLKQVLVNLVSNAVKFTPRGGNILIDAVLYSRNGRHSLEVSVKDSGIGIAPKQLKHIFEEYTQLRTPVAGQETPIGSGLGLAIVKKIIDLHGGTLGVDSKPGEGSTFHFSIPYKTAAAPPAPAAPAHSPATLPDISRALIVEDNPLNRRLLEIILERLRIEHATATNGAEGLQMMQEQYFDIVFTDISMPEMDGLALVRHIRRLADPRKAHVPVIAITGNAVKEELDMYMSSGFTSYIVKPFRETDVVDKINLTRRNGLMTKLRQ
ncbi:ATP-binding response regulator [Chitinophaga alhagiae]|uniref:ATP-binding response regulator n=1 Tax=Chitinophaga alhagiae TaxID=2203219 RepID=UPI000E5BF39F|nr:ATP-binding protein [Chitinophaga alhagiae]